MMKTAWCLDANCRAYYVLLAHNAKLIEALRDAYSHVTLLATGQDTPDSNAEMCERLGKIVKAAERSQS